MKHFLLLILSTVAFAATQDDNSPRHYPDVPPPPTTSQGLRQWLSAYWSRATLHSIVHRDDRTCLVFSTVAPRDERHIHWVSVRGGAVIAYQSHYIESPRRLISGSIDGWRHGILRWSAEGMFSHGGDELVDEGYSGFYDPASPEKGLQTKETYKLPIK